MTKWFVSISLLLVCLAMIPPALIARQRAVTFTKPRIHIIQDMDAQLKFKAQNPNTLFNDGRSMRPPLEGVIARGDLMEDAHFYKGVVNDEWAATFPARIPVTLDLVRRGQERFNIYCQPCHGIAGYGDGIVNQRAMRLMDAPLLGNGTTWVQPKSVHEEAIREQPVGQIFNSITNGVRNMSGYASQVPTADRWAIVAYVKALQRSQHARETDVSERERAGLGDPIDRRTQSEEGGGE